MQELQDQNVKLATLESLISSQQALIGELLQQKKETKVGGEEEDKSSARSGRKRSARLQDVVAGGDGRQAKKSKRS